MFLSTNVPGLSQGVMTMLGFLLSLTTARTSAALSLRQGRNPAERRLRFDPEVV